MKTIAVDSNGNFLRDSSGNIAFLTGLAAVEQVCASVMRARLGEMIYALDQGIPYFQTVFNNFNPAGFEIAARTALEAVPGVTAVTAFTVAKVGDQVQYTATIATIYGTGQVAST